MLTAVSAVEQHVQTQLDHITAPATQVTMETGKHIVHQTASIKYLLLYFQHHFTSDFNWTKLESLGHI